MRKELEEILSKTVDDMTPADARFYDMALNHNKRLAKGSSIFMAGVTALALAAGFGFGFPLNLTLGVIIGIAVELTGMQINLFYALADIDQQIENNCFRFQKGEKKEFKKAHGFEKMRQLLTEYEELYGKSYLNEDNDPQSYDEYLKKVEAAQANEKLAAEQTSAVVENKTNKVVNEKTIAENEKGEGNNTTL